MAGPCCDNCIYGVCDPELWRRLMWVGEPILPRCANHPRWPGQLREVPGTACPNYRRKPKMPGGDAVRLIPLSGGFYAYVDAADYEWLNQWVWNLAGGGYAARNDNGKTVLMHRQIMQPPKGMVVDHIDGNRANDCRFNLRVCTRQENHRNMRKQNGAVSRFKGVTYAKRYEKWYARCWFEGRDHFLGSFDDEVEAARVYDRQAVEWLGEFARLNFPEEWPPERRAEVYAKRKPPECKKAGSRKAAGSREKATRKRHRPRKTCAARGRPAGKRRRQAVKAKDGGRKAKGRASSIVNRQASTAPRGGKRS